MTCLPPIPANVQKVLAKYKEDLSQYSSWNEKERDNVIRKYKPKLREAWKEAGYKVTGDKVEKIIDGN